MNKKVLFLDAGKVFVTFEERHEVLTRVARVAQAPTIPTYQDFVSCGILAASHDGTHEGPYELIDSGQVSWNGIYQKFLTVTGLTEEQFPEFRFWATFCRHLEPIDGVVTLLQEIQDQQIPLVVISNGEFGSQHAADLVSFKYGITWAGVVISSQVLAKKPGDEMWKAAEAIGRKQVPGLMHDQMAYVDDVKRYCDAFV